MTAALCFGDSAPRLAARSGDEPGVQFLRLLDVVQLLKESGKDVLEDLSRLLVVEAGTKRNGVNQTLVTSYQFLPSELLSTSACQYQLQVTIVHLSRHKAYPQITPID